MYQDVNQAPPQPPTAVPPFAQTMASAAASHVVHQQQHQQQAQQYIAQQLDPTAGGVAHQVAPPSAAMAMAASAIVAGGQTLVKRVVKGVISGDYLILRDQPRGGPPPEYYVNLAHVQAPRFNRNPGDGEGKSSQLEPWAWEAKEYLTKRLIGQEVYFRSEYQRSGGPQGGGATSGIASGNRDFGIVFLNEENIVETMVREGLLEVRRTKTDSPILQQLIEAEEAAKVSQKGRWSGQAPEKRELIHENPHPNQLKGKTFTGTVEAVRNGGALQVYLELEEGRKYLSANVMVSGIRCPDKNKTAENRFSEEAKYFTESRLLNREVKVHIEKITSDRNQTAYLASVFLGQNNLAEHLLRQGMARCFDASITLTKAPEKLRAAEKEAKQKRLRIWENYVDKGDGPSEAFEAKVLEVISGDQLMVQNLSTNEVKKIFLASIRLGAPVDRDRQREARAADAEQAVTEPKQGSKQSGRTAQAASQPEVIRSSVPRIFENPILFNARELLRKKLLGKKVLVKVEYVQPKSDAYTEKLCCTVAPADQPKWNCAEALVSRGYASVNKFMSDDSQRASNFDELLKAEQNALKSKDTKDKDKQKELAPLKIVDLCNDLPRAKQLYPFLSRTRKDAVVEFVYSASRFKMFLAKENNSLLNLILAGVNVPREPDALKNEATNTAKLLVHQRDVTIQIDSMDKKGNFIGWIFYKGEDNKETSINLQLVKLGLAQVRDSSAASTLNELKAAEVVAREKKLGLWLTYQEPKAVNEEAGTANEVNDENEAPEDEGSAANATANALAAKEAELLKNRKPVIVTYAHNDETSLRVFVQSFEDGAKLEELMKQMRSDLPSGGGKKGGAGGEGYMPSRNEIVAARFSEDKLWYRAKVEKVISPSEIDILFIDYGNREKVKSHDLVKLSPKYASPDPCAKEYALAFIEISTHDQDWVEEARREFVGSTMGKLLMRVEYRDPVFNLDAISLVDEITKTDIGKKLVEDGLLITQRRRERKLMRTINEYLQAEKTARRNRSAMWQYGDFTKDDAKEFGHRSAAA